jgi:hypothetical protein
MNCKTVGSAYVGSNPTPATSQSRRSGGYAKLARPLKVSGAPNRRLSSRWLEPNTCRHHPKQSLTSAYAFGS